MASVALISPQASAPTSVGPGNMPVAQPEIAVAQPSFALRVAALMQTNEPMAILQPAGPQALAAGPQAGAWPTAQPGQAGTAAAGGTGSAPVEKGAQDATPATPAVAGPTQASADPSPPDPSSPDPSSLRPPEPSAASDPGEPIVQRRPAGGGAGSATSPTGRQGGLARHPAACTDQQASPSADQTAMPINSAAAAICPPVTAPPTAASAQAGDANADRAAVSYDGVHHKPAPAAAERQATIAPAAAARTAEAPPAASLATAAAGQPSLATAPVDPPVPGTGLAFSQGSPLAAGGGTSQDASWAPATEATADATAIGRRDGSAAADGAQRAGGGTPSAAAQVAPVLVSLGRAGGASRLTLRLEPADLGRVQIRIDRGTDATARVAITVERPQTLALLLRDQPQLQNALDRAGLPADGRSVTFHIAGPDTDRAQAGRAQAGGSAQVHPADSQSGSGGYGAARHGGSDSGGQAAGQERRQSGGGGRDADAVTGRGQDGSVANIPIAVPRWLAAGLDITA